MNAYEARLEARRERLEARAEKLRREGQGRVDRAHEMASAIPFGQPILIGHHSEKRDRAFRGRIHSNFDKGFQALKAAGELEARAANVGSGGISSDDPDAIAKLLEKLEKAQNLQNMMVRANKVIKAFWKAGVRDAASGDKWELYLQRLEEAGCKVGPGRAKLLLEPDFAGRIGFADYQLQNNGAEVRRIKARIEQLKANAGREASEQQIGEIKIVENVELNRLQIIFPGKPDAQVRAKLKSAGFRWAPSEGAWQRHLSNAARYWAGEIVKGG